MCFFVCLALPLKATRLIRDLSQGFELTDATDWNIGRITRGNRERDVAFLVADGGCSCFISVTQSHSYQSGKRKQFETLVSSLLQELSQVSLLFHYSSKDISQDIFSLKARRVVSLKEISHQFQQLECDTRYVIRGIERLNQMNTPR